MSAPAHPPPSLCYSHIYVAVTVPMCRLAAQASKFSYWLRDLDQGDGRIDWVKLLNNVIRHDRLLNTSSHLTKSYHVALGVAMHVGQDGSGSARELEQNVENFLKKPVEWVIGPDRCARARR